MIVWWLSLALAQEPAPAEDDHVQGEVIVYGDWLVDQARADLVDQAKQQGYTRRIERDGYVLYRSPDLWRGDLRVYDDGWVRISRQPVQIRPPNSDSAKDAKITQWLWCLWPTACVHGQGQWVSKRKFDAQRGRAYDGVYPEVRDWADAMADRAVDGRLKTLPDELQALWDHGTPLAGEAPAPLETLAQRRDAILAFWTTRSDNEWGDRVRESVEAFWRAEVQTSDVALTREELAAFNATRPCARELRLSWAPEVDAP